MGDIAGGGADGYYRRYTYDQLVSMVLADSIDDAEANRTQWRRLGHLLADAAAAADKIAKQIPDHYRSQHGAPALLELLNDTNDTASKIGQVALDNGTAWLGVKQSLQDAQKEVLQLEMLAQTGLAESARDQAADRIQSLTSEYINHANDILPPSLPGAWTPEPNGSGDSTADPTSGARGDATRAATSSDGTLPEVQSGKPGAIPGAPGPSLSGGPPTLPSNAGTPGAGTLPGDAGNGVGRGTRGVIGAPP